MPERKSATIKVRVEHSLKNGPGPYYTTVTDQEGRIVNGVTRVDFVDDVKSGTSLILHLVDFDLVVEGEAELSK